MLSFAAIVSAQTAPRRVPLTLTQPLEDKNFHLLSLIERSPAARAAVSRDASLTHLCSERQAALDQVIPGQHLEAAQYASPLLWTKEQIELAADALRSLYSLDAAIRELTDRQLQPSGVGPGWLSGAELLAATWQAEAAGMNRIVATYAEGDAPRSPEIDSLSYDAHSEEYREFLHELARTIDADPMTGALFFSGALQFSLMLLEANQRDEAARFEPLETGEKAAALVRLKSINWKQFRYAAILVPGMGPELPAVPLSPMGRLRVAAAATAYKTGQAPFLLLSGGYVHPSQTPFNEALEMKKLLLREFHTPANAILIDPHARHTTTNLRDAARILYRYGFPLDKPVLIVTDIYQAAYIASDEFAQRCDHELGYRPFRKLTALPPGEVAWEPAYANSLFQDPLDPLDP
jgi:hypothetical protein